MRSPLWALAAIGSLGVLSGCQSTVDAAKKLSAQGAAAFSQKGLSVTRSDKQFSVLHSWVLHDSNGAAAVIDIRYRGSQPMAQAPIAINVRDRRGNSVFRNNIAGLEPALDHLPFMTPDETFTWVNDQLQPSGTPASVAARIGVGVPIATARLPRIEVSGVKLAVDPVSGADATGSVRNLSQILQKHLVIYAVARRGAEVVAAGRAIIPRLLPGKSAIFHAFFIGDPRGATLTVTAPPAVVS